MDEPLLDLSGLKCPLPALKLRKALMAMPAGRLRVICTDPMAVIDIPHAVRESGARLVEERREEERLWFRIEKCGE